jgi:predicted dehydrogenase
MAVTQADCDAIAAECTTRPDLVFAVCHVLRYTPFNRLIHQLIHDGAIGDLVHIQVCGCIPVWATSAT